MRKTSTRDAASLTARLSALMLVAGALAPAAFARVADPTPTREPSTEQANEQSTEQSTEQAQLADEAKPQAPAVPKTDTPAPAAAERSKPANPCAPAPRRKKARNPCA